jgi:hypothetical protein
MEKVCFAALASGLPPSVQLHGAVSGLSPLLAGALRELTGARRLLGIVHTAWLGPSLLFCSWRCVSRVRK